MWELDCEESWAPKNWCFWTVVLEKTLESPLDCKEIQPVHSKRDESWVFFGRNDAKAETPVLWPTHAKSWLIGKNSDAGRDWRQEEKGMTGWDGWMASLTQSTWVWVNSGSCWWTRRPRTLHLMGSQRVRHDWVTELNWIELSTIWAFCQLILMSVYHWRPFVSMKCSLGILANWFSCLTTIEDHLFWGSVCLGLHISHLFRGLVADLSFHVWVCTPFVWLVLLLP